MRRSVDLEAFEENRALFRYDAGRPLTPGVFAPALGRVRCRASNKDRHRALPARNELDAVLRGVWRRLDFPSGQELQEAGRIRLAQIHPERDRRQPARSARALLPSDRTRCIRQRDLGAGPLLHAGRHKLEDLQDIRGAGARRGKGQNAGRSCREPPFLNDDEPRSARVGAGDRRCRRAVRVHFRRAGSRQTPHLAYGEEPMVATVALAAFDSPPGRERPTPTRSPPRSRRSKRTRRSLFQCECPKCSPMSFV